jgi:hypothetical protein
MTQSDFDGTWKVDLTKSTMPDKPHVFLLQNGTYQRKTCVPPINLKADGEDHGVAGSPYYDAVAVKVLCRQREKLIWAAGTVSSASDCSGGSDFECASHNR